MKANSSITRTHIFTYMSYKAYIYTYILGGNGSVCNDWTVDSTPTGQQNGPTNGGVVSTPLPSKLLSSSLKEVRRADTQETL